MLENLQAKPPRDGLPLKNAIRKYHLAPKTLKKYITAGTVRAGVGYVTCGQTRRRCIFVSSRDLERVTAATTNAGRHGRGALPPSDGMPIQVLSRELGVTGPTLRAWCGWKSHPVLGRKVKSGFGPFVIEAKDGEKRTWRGLLMSRTDAKSCTDALKVTPVGKKFPGNPGVWISLATSDGEMKGQSNIDGVFLHENRGRFYTPSYIARNNGVGSRLFSKDGHTDNLESIEVFLPNKGFVEVFSKDSVERVLNWKEGNTDDGHWLTPNEIWVDFEGKHYAHDFIARKMPCSLNFVSYMQEDGLLGLGKLVPRDRGKDSKVTGGSIPVFLEREIFPLLNLHYVGPRPPALNDRFVVDAYGGKRDDQQNCEQQPPAAAIKAKAGRRINKGNEVIYATCYVLYPLVETRKIKMKVAIAEVERIHGSRSLCRRDSNNNSDFDIKRRRLKLNAKWFNKNLNQLAQVAETDRSVFGEMIEKELVRQKKLAAEQRNKTQNLQDLSGGKE